MLVSDLFHKLSLGELSNLSLSGEGSGDILEDKKPRILAYINEALLRLYSRFVLLEDDLILEQLPWILNYPLEMINATTQAPPPAGKHTYILDTEAKPFTGDVIKITRVRNDHGYQIPINDEESPFSVFTPSPQILRVPKPAAGRLLGVDYQAKHPELTEATDRILLPDTLHKALSSYVAYLTFSHMNTQEMAVKSQEHLSLYEGVCQEVERMDLVNSSSSQTNTRFAKRGWI